MRRCAALLTAAALGLPLAVHAQLKNPSDWSWRLDTPATLVTSLTVPSGSWLFAMMPPGWHVTTGPSALLYPATAPPVDGNFSVETQIFLFPGKSEDEYGVFIGGQALDDQEPPEFTAFVLRRDGQAAVVRRTRDGLATVAGWRRHEGVIPHAGGADPIQNVIRVDVGPAKAALVVNGKQVIEVPRAEIGAAGRIGFRIGADLNLHITSLDVTRRWAPQPAS